MAPEKMNIVNLRELRERQRRKLRERHPDAPSESFGIDPDAERKLAAAPRPPGPVTIEYIRPTIEQSRAEAQARHMRTPHEPQAYTQLRLSSRPSGKGSYTPDLPPGYRTPLIGTRRGSFDNAGDGDLTNRFGLRSRAAELYPGLFKPGANVYWTVLSDEERDEIVKLQAAAQERVGFTSGSPKFFIEDFQPVNDKPVGGNSTLEDPDSSPWEITESDRGYLQRKRNYQRRQRELAEFKSGKRKRRPTTPSRSSDDGNAVILGMPSVWRYISTLASEVENIFGGASIAQSAIHDPGQYDRMPGVRPLGTAPDKTVSSEDLTALDGVQLYTTEKERDGASKRLRRKKLGEAKESSVGMQAFNPADLTNRYGLTNSSAMNYPGAYAPVAKEFRTEASSELQAQRMKLQAIAQEKVGFEEGTDKFFIEDFTPGGVPRKAVPRASMEEMSAPRYVMGGAFMGMGFLALVLGLFSAIPFGYGVAGGLCCMMLGASMVWFQQH
jgi:hypothetical protein